MKITGSDIHLFKVFDAVVRNGGITPAQTELNLSQPTISNHIAALEERLGVQLCQRGRGGFRLTEKGRIVHDLIVGFLNKTDDASAQLSSLRGSLVGTLRVATVDSVSTDVNMRLPQAVARFTAQAASVDLRLSINGPLEIQGMLLDGSVHVGIASFDNRFPGLAYEYLYREQHYLYCAAGHPLFEVQEASLTLDTLLEYPTVHRGYWTKRRQKTAGLSGFGPTANEIEAQVLLVLSGTYLALLPEHAAAGHVKEGRLRPLLKDQTLYECDFEMVTRKGRQPRVVRAFMDSVREAFATV